MKIIVTETVLETYFWSAAIRTVAYFLRNGFTLPHPRQTIYGDPRGFHAIKNFTGF